MATLENRTESAAADLPERNKSSGMRRRTFLQTLGGVAAGAAILSRAGSAQAGNGWAVGAADKLSKEQLLKMHTNMLKARWWEELLKDAWLKGEDDLYGFVHLSIGQEGIAAGAIAALRDDDFITCHHRSHAQLIAKGGDLNKMSAEIWFKSGGYNRGYGGSMHMTDMTKGILGMNGIVGSQHILAPGAAYGIKVRGTDQVSVAFGGDGSINNGWFFDGLRNAKLYNLPLITFIENNGWQIGNPTENTNPNRDLATVSRAFDIPGVVVDGQDALAVYSVMKDAVDRARAGGGPTVIEAKTYRFYDHAMFAGAKVGEFGAFGLPYRSDSDVHSWIANDPIPKLERTLVAMGLITNDEIDQLVEDIKAEVLASFDYARQNPDPNEDQGLEHVFAEGTVEASQFFA